MENECRFCKGNNVVKYGHRNNKSNKVQVYLCKSCNRIFSENTTFSKMRYKEEIITSVLDLYFRNASLRGIQDHLQVRGTKISHVTILNWVRKYSRMLKEYTDNLKINNSDSIHADEMMVNVNGNWMWLWNVIDKNTKFILSSHLSKTRKLSDAKKIFFETKSKLNNEPKVIVTDGLLTYKRAFNKVFWKRKNPQVEYKRLVGFIEKINNNVIERFHGTVRERTKIMRGFDRFNSARDILGGLITYYNFIRPHDSLNGLTPAEASGVDLNLKGNKWSQLIRLSEENMVKNYV